MIRFSRVSKIFPQCMALQNITIQIAKGEYVLLTGPSGAGKTTFLKLVFGGIVPDKGLLLVQNRNVARLQARDVPYFRRTIGLVLQDFMLFPCKTVFHNVALPLVIQGKTRIETRKKVNEALQEVGMDHKQGLQAGLLSAGEQQRVCIARAVVHRPDLLLADEPTGNLDSQTTLKILELFHAIHSQGTTVVLATHNQLVVDHVNGRVLQLESGLLVGDSGS